MSNTTTLWVFPDSWFEDGGRAILEAAGGRERTFRKMPWTEFGETVLPFVWVEVSDETKPKMMQSIWPKEVGKDTVALEDFDDE